MLQREATTENPTGTVTAAEDRLVDAEGDGWGRSVMLGVLIIVLIDPFIVAAIVYFTTGRWDLILLVLALTIALPIVLVPLSVWATWRPWSRRYPARPQRADAVVRTWESVGFGWFARFNHCVHVAADSSHLHLIPMKPLRWAGAKVLSIPWRDITNVETAFLPETMKARLGRRRFLAPAWCLRLAADASTSEAPQPNRASKAAGT